MVAVKHTQVTAADNPAHPVSANAWNAAHTITGTAGKGIAFDANGAAAEVDPFIPMASRSVLAAVTTQASGSARYLNEAGREGTFVWSSANNATNVTADPQQGLYVAPASDTTGASGAWVRKFNGRANPQWWGGTWNGIADDSATVNAALATAFALGGSNITTYGTAAFSLQFPFLPNGVYMGTTPMATLTKAIAIYGESGGHFGGEATTFKWAVGLTASAIKIAALNCWLDGLALEGPYTSGTALEAEIHGIEATFTFGYGRLWVRGFQGDGVNINASVGNGTNANGTRGFSLHTNNNRNGLYLAGGDSNAGCFTFINANYNRQAGVHDASGLGNGYGVVQTSGNGTTSVAGIPTTCCYNSGFMFTVVSGQEVAAQTNGPPSTATSNTWWIFSRNLGAPTTYAPQWVSGTQTFRAGGGFYVPVANASNASTVGHLYTESDQAPTQTAQAVMIYGGLNGAGFGPNTRRITAGNSGTTIVKGYITKSLGFAPDTGQIFQIDGTVSNTSPTIDLKDGAAGGGQFIQFHDSAGVLKGSIQAGSGSGLFINHVSGVTLRFNGTGVLSTTTTGVNIATGKTLQVNGTQVITSQQTGTASAATDLASAIALVNDLRAKLVTHGLIA